MKTVVFAASDCIRSTIAATFFDAFTSPMLIRARAVCGGERTPPEVLAAMREIGFDGAPEVHGPSPRALDNAVLVVRFGDVFPASALPSEQWDVPMPAGPTAERVRSLRDALRQRVWRLVALQGWYKLQPARALPIRPAYARI